jgi:hypothetical protein
MSTYTFDNITYTYSSNASVTGFVPGIITATILSSFSVLSVTYEVKSIVNNAFLNATSMTSVSIPSSITQIGTSAFQSCTALISVTIPNSVSAIGNNAFQSCSSMTSITLPPNQPLFTTIGDAVFAGCASLTSITFPNSITGIAASAFINCTGLLSITFSRSLNTIGTSAFQNCNKLPSVIIPDSVTSIGVSAFRNCFLLTSVTLPINQSFTSILTNTFLTCSALTSISIPKSVTSIGASAFQFCGVLDLVTFGRTPTLPTIGTNAFASIGSSSTAKVYDGTNTTPISGLFLSISTMTLPTLTSITLFNGATATSGVISYANLVTNGNEDVSNTPYVFLVNSVSTGTLSIGATQETATPWNASTNKTISAGTNAYWTPPLSVMNALLTAFSVVIQDQGGQVSSPNVNVNVNVRYPCFLEGTKILCFENNNEVYRPIERLQKGDLVKTIYNGYIPICMIGTTSIYNPGNDYRVANRIYKCSREKYPALFEDLYITGCHSILVPWMTDDQWENTKAVNGDVFVTDNHFRLIACADEKAEPFNKEGFMNIYHIALEHPDIFMNYGIYANGLLVESCSERNLRELSNMRILGEADTAVSEGVDKMLIRQLVDTY